MDLSRLTRALSVVSLGLGAILVGVSIARDGVPGSAVGWIVIALGVAGWAAVARTPPPADD